jgi:hypothetical protein
VMKRKRLNRRKRQKRLIAITAAGALASTLVATFLSTADADTDVPRQAETLTIDLGTDSGAFHGGASGSLYGVYGDGVPSNAALEGMHVRTVSTKAQDGPQHPGADALEILPSFVDAGGEDVYVYMTDIYRGFPYEWPGDTGEARLADFRERIRTQVEQAQTMGEYADHIVWVPFNEPEGNMFGTGEWSYNGVSWRDDPQHYFAAWEEVYHLIRDIDPDARIAGPNTSTLYDEVRGFLEFARDNDVMPDVMTWHELSNPDTVRTSVAGYRQMEEELGIGPLPINVNEYGHNYHLSVPGQMIQWMSAIEESKIDADLAYWNIDGNLNDSVVGANRGNGQWWLYNAYGQMSGHTVEVTAPHPNEQYTLQGLATLDPDKRQARAIFGGTSTATDVVFDNIDPAVFGDTVRATAWEIPWSGQVGDSAQPLRALDTELAVENGQVTLPFDGLNDMSAYQVILTPGGNGAEPTQPSVPSWRQTYEAEDAAHTGTGYSLNGPEGSPDNVGGFATSGGYNVGGLRTDSDVQLSFDVDVPTTGTYDLSVFANSLNTYDLVAERGPTNVFLRVDGENPQELRLPLGYKWVVWDHADTTVELAEGRHTITLAAQDPELGATQGDAIIDKIDLSLRDEAVTAPAIYEAEYATVTGDTTLDYAARNTATLTGGGAATFWVYSPTARQTTVSVDHAGGGTASLALNNAPVDGVTVGAEEPGTTDVPLHLSGGINKITLTGATGALAVDRLLTSTPTDGPEPAVYQAEDGRLTGAATATDAYPFASGGTSVTDIGDGQDNALTVTVNAERAGQHAVTIRYSNAEEAPATHYNPDPVARHADISVNGGDPTRVRFPTTFHFNNFWELTVPLDLQAGENTLTFTSEELPNFDGETYNQYQQRSRYAPVIDQLTVAPLAAL